MRHYIGIEGDEDTVVAYAELSHPDGKWYRIWARPGGSGWYVHSDYGNCRYVLPVEGCQFWERTYGVWNSERYDTWFGAIHEMKSIVLNKLDGGYQLVRSGEIKTGELKTGEVKKGGDTS